MAAVCSIDNQGEVSKERANFDMEDNLGDDIKDELDLVVLAELSNRSYHTFDNAYDGTTTLTMNTLLHRSYRASESWRTLSGLTINTSSPFYASNPSRSIPSLQPLGIDKLTLFATRLAVTLPPSCIPHKCSSIYNGSTTNPHPSPTQIILWYSSYIKQNFFITSCTFLTFSFSSLILPLLI